jgi:nucleotide-binding universal stress UspA family protein
MIEKEVQSYMKAKVSKLKMTGINVTGITRDGSAPDVILDVAEETHADMIAMATHGRSGVQRWLMGSVAEKVVHHARIPVMLIHPSLN